MVAPPQPTGFESGLAIIPNEEKLRGGVWNEDQIFS